MVAALQSGSSPADRPPQKAVGVITRGLLVRSATGTPLLGPVSLTIPTGSLTIVTGGTPASRYALGCAITGRVPLERLRLRGLVQVGDRTSPPLIRAITALPQSWHVRRAQDTSERRLAALEWAHRRHPALAALTPGLDGLDEAERHALLRAARALVDDDITVVLTATSQQVGSPERELADATIVLDEQPW